MVCLCVGVNALLIYFFRLPGTIESRETSNRQFAHTIFMSRDSDSQSYVVDHDILVFLDEFTNSSQSLHEKETAEVPSRHEEKVKEKEEEKTITVGLSQQCENELSPESYYEKDVAAGSESRDKGASMCRKPDETEVEKCPTVFQLDQVRNTEQENEKNILEILVSLGTSVDQLQLEESSQIRSDDYQVGVEPTLPPVKTAHWKSIAKPGDR